MGFRFAYFRLIITTLLVMVFGKPNPPVLKHQKATPQKPSTTIVAYQNGHCPEAPDSHHLLMAEHKSLLGPRLVVKRDAVFRELKQLAVDNDAFFRNSNSCYGSRLAECCQEIARSTDLLQDLVKQMLAVSHTCDYDENTPGNGYRSLICVADVAIVQLITILKEVTESRSNIMFRISHYCKEVDGFTAVIRFLILAFQQVVTKMEMFEENSLFPSLEGKYERYNSFLRGLESLDTSCFYARPLGFQFAPSVARVFRVIGFVLATYSLSWDKEEGPISSFVNSGKYLMSPEQRAMRIVKVIRESDIEFCKGFWNLSEIGMMSKWFSPYMAVCDTREISLHGPLPLRTKSGEIILVAEPSSHTGPRSVPYRILSYVPREGLCPPNATQKFDRSPYLLIHCHGGGYVATSSKSHETYLREWAVALNCPIVSIDYSLAPENPYPRATEDVLYAYTYILNNPKKFGWTGEKLVMVGDSAGGNLITSVSLSLIQVNAARIPDGLIPVYTPFLFQYLPSPSRVLSFMDPLLHMGVVIRCAAAYTGVKLDEHEEAKEEETKFSSLLRLDLPRDPQISPMYASDELLRKLPPFYFVACHLDPLLDDTIMFARKLRSAGGNVRRVDLLDYIPHGFLNFTLVSPDCQEGSKFVISRIREAFGSRQ